MTVESLSLVLHAMCAVVYVGLAGMILLQSRRSALGQLLALACMATALWAGSVAWLGQGGGYGGGGAQENLPGWLVLARGVAWHCFLMVLYRRSLRIAQARSQLLVMIGLLAALLIAATPLANSLSEEVASGFSLGLLARMGIAIANILVLENLYFNSEEEDRWKLRLLCIPLGGMFIYDVVLYADAVLFHRISPVLFVGRASLSILVAPLIALAVARKRVLDVHLFVSRSVVFHSASLVASGLFLLSLGAAGEILRQTGAEWGMVAEISLISGGLLFVLLVLTSGTARSHLRRLLAEHFFTQRYDYRAEWTRSIAMLSTSSGDIGLQTRAIRAVAQIADSPAGALFQRDPGGAVFQWSGSWNQPAATHPLPPDHALIAALKKHDRALTPADIAEGENAARAGLSELPPFSLAVPLWNLDELLGFVLLAPPRAPLKLDLEVTNLLTIVGREVASRLAERQAIRALSESRQLHDYAKRFAFVVHDVKNVSGQLSMLLANAEHHAANPAFQRDMLVTVRAAVARINGMLEKLQRARGDAGTPGLILPAERLRTVLGGGKLDAISLDIDQHNANVAMDAESFDAVIIHLVDNAQEAAGVTDAAGTKDVGTGEVNVSLRHESLSMIIDITDTGPGMTPEFIRDELFTPLRSTKRGGHGIGVFQARELLREASGDLLAISRVGTGTTMRLVLPLAGVPATPSAPPTAASTAASTAETM